MVYIESMPQEGHELQVIPTQDVPIEEQDALKAYEKEYAAFIAATPAADLARGLAMQRLALEKHNAALEAENQALEKRTDRDPYNPNVYSLAGFLRTMRAKAAELRRNGQAAAILAIDLDGFKAYNDTNPDRHAGGDRALGLAGDLIRSVVRPSDLVARLHGDEYAVLLVGIENLDGAVVGAEKIREAIEQMSTILQTNVSLSASIGIARLAEDVIADGFGNEEEFDKAVNRSYKVADGAHYEGAKNAGKNRIGVLLNDGSVKTAFATNVSQDPQRPTYSVIYEQPISIPTHR